MRTLVLTGRTKKRIVFTILLAGLVFVGVTFVWSTTRTVGGPTVYGTPFTFYKKGCADIPPFTLNCVNWFSWEYLILDIVLFSLPAFAVMTLLIPEKRK